MNKKNNNVSNIAVENTENKMPKGITIGVPCYHAHGTIKNLLASIQIQTMRDFCTVILSNDDPKDNGTYDQYRTLYPDLDIVTLDCKKNGGPGTARQLALLAATTPWITFMDADDVLYNSYSIENLVSNITPTCIEVMGSFCQEVDQGKLSASQKMQILQAGGKIPPRLMPRNDVGHPWVFGRLYNVGFLRENKIGLSGLRAMEDGEFNWKIRMMIEGTKLQINRIEDPIYIWKTGSEHSITRIGVEENDGVPLYNWDLCMVGSTVAAINAIKFCRAQNPFNGGVLRFAVEHMIGQYFTYIKCLNEKPMFAKQNLFNAKRFYNAIYKDIEKTISPDIVKTIYTAQYAGQAMDMIGIIPEITFFEFMDKIAKEEYRGREEWIELRKELPDWVIEKDKYSGVLGEEDFIPYDGEEESK